MTILSARPKSVSLLFHGFHQSLVENVDVEASNMPVPHDSLSKGTFIVSQ